MSANTGMSLRRPGESLYSMYRRFLIVNKGSIFNSQTSRKALIELANVTLGDYDASLRSVELFSRIECEIVGVNSLAKSSMLSPITFFAKSIKNCDECSKIGFHSELYNLPWITRCPVHKTDLSTRCGTCNKVWPVVSKLLGSDCETCGVKITFSKLCERNAFTSDNRFKSFNEFTKFNARAVTAHQYSIKEYNSQYSPSERAIFRKDANLYSRFTPSALLSNVDNTFWTRSRLEMLGVKTYRRMTLTFPRSQFEAKEKPLLSSHDAEQILERVKIRLLAALFRTQKRFSTDTFRTRLMPWGENISTASKAWHYFIAFGSWINNLRRGLDPNRSELEAFWEIDSILADKSILPRPTYPDRFLNRYISVDGSYSSTKDKVNMIGIPKPVLEWMYYTELLICFLHTYLQLSFLKECEERGDKYLVDIGGIKAPDSLRFDGLLANPYYIHADEKKVSITIPKILMQPRLSLSHELLTS